MSVGVGTSGTVPGLRLAVGYAAIAATVPYLALKAAWLSGRTVGLNDPHFFSDHPGYVVGNLLTVGMDGAAVLIAFALTRAWGLRLPARLVLFPMWVATGFLAPIVFVVPFAPAAFGEAGATSGPLRGWVYLLVYGGFAAQGLLLSAAFALYAKSRWGGLLLIRNGGAAGRARGRRTAVAVALAVLAGALHLAWALGSEVGLPRAVLSDPPVGYHLTNGVYGGFAFAAAVGLFMLAYGWPRRVRLWAPLSLAWAGSGSLLSWGLWQAATMAARPGMGTPLLAAAVSAKVVAGALAGATAVWLLRGRPGLGPGGGEEALPPDGRDG